MNQPVPDKDDSCAQCGQADPRGDYYGGLCTACDLRGPAEEDLLEDGAEQRARDLEPESPERIAARLAPLPAPEVGRAIAADVAASRIHALRAHRRRLQADLDDARAALAMMHLLLDHGWPAMIPRARALAGLDLATAVLDMDDDLEPRDPDPDAEVALMGETWLEWRALARAAAGADEGEVAGA